MGRRSEGKHLRSENEGFYLSDFEVPVQDGEVRIYGMLNIPPPAYHPDSSYLTLAIYFGGTFENNLYMGGKVRKIDYVDIEKLNFETLDEFVHDVIVQGRKSRMVIM